jgi:hypothetical protein
MQEIYMCLFRSAALQRVLVGQGACCVLRPGDYVIRYIPPAAMGVLGTYDFLLAEGLRVQEMR